MQHTAYRSQSVPGHTTFGHQALWEGTQSIRFCKMNTPHMLENLILSPLAARRAKCIEIGNLCFKIMCSILHTTALCVMLRLVT